ncbi:MAG TPA: amidohydrolase, partial [Actinomycetota bacterium]|nr:amidohydrolase [Actinomycetota bacterium]
MTRAADLVFRNGVVWDHAGTPGRAPRALAVSGGRIVAVGADAEALAAIAGEVVDLAGGALLPSFGDGHVHPIFGGLGQRFADVRNKSSVAELVDSVARWAAEHPDEPWVRGDGYDPTLAPGGVFEAAWLDAVVPDRPAWLRASDFHTAWVNTVALEMAGIGTGTPDPDGGEIVRRPDGSPVGTLREWGALHLVEAVAPRIPAGVLVDCLLQAARHLASLGFTWVQDAMVQADGVDAWLAAAASGGLAVRGNLALLASPETWRADLDRFVAQRDRVAREGRGVVSANSVKFFADGVIEAGTGALLEPYDDCPHSHGLPNWDWPELAEAVAAVDALGFQPHIHAIGDAGVRGALDAFAVAEQRNGPRDRRPVIAHAHVVDPADRPRFAELGVVANFEPLWARPEPLITELTEPRLGPTRSGYQYPIASLLRSGRVSFGTDWPVTSPDPRAGLAVAVTRRLLDGSPHDPWLPEERITIQEAVAAYTRGVAYQAFEESAWGDLVPGARADLVHLGADPRGTDPLDLPK